MTKQFQTSECRYDVNLADNLIQNGKLVNKFMTFVGEFKNNLPYFGKVVFAPNTRTFKKDLLIQFEGRIDFIKDGFKIYGEGRVDYKYYQDEIEYYAIGQIAQNYLQGEGEKKFADGEFQKSAFRLGTGIGFGVTKFNSGKQHIAFRQQFDFRPNLHGFGQIQVNESYNWSGTFLRNEKHGFIETGCFGDRTQSLYKKDTEVAILSRVFENGDTLIGNGFSVGYFQKSAKSDIKNNVYCYIKQATTSVTKTLEMSDFCFKVVLDNKIVFGFIKEGIMDQVVAEPIVLNLFGYDEVLLFKAKFGQSSVYQLKFGSHLFVGFADNSSSQGLKGFKGVYTTVNSANQPIYFGYFDELWLLQEDGMVIENGKIVKHGKFKDGVLTETKFTKTEDLSVYNFGLSDSFVINHISGDVYVGSLNKNLAFEGTGALIQHNNQVSEGVFINGQISELREISFGNGDKLEIKEVKNSKEAKSYEGVYSYVDGRTYTGNLNLQFKPHGQGAMKDIYEQVLNGLWVNGEPGQVSVLNPKEEWVADDELLGVISVLNSVDY